MIERHRHTGLTGDGEKISYNDLKDKPESSGVPVIGFHTISSSVSTGNYDLTSSDIDFTPKMVRIQVTMTLGNINAYSDMSTDGTNTGGAKYEGYDLSDDKGIWGYSTTRMIFVQGHDTGGSYGLFANFVEFIDGGVRINITSNSAVANLYCTITAYK